MGVGTIVDQRSDELSFWPFGFGVVFLCQTVPSTFIGDRNFREVILLNGLVKMHDKLSWL